METTSTVDALTPLHAAPEVIEQQGPVSPLSDVWSLASTLWTALAGVAPFGRPQDPPLTVMMRIVRDPLPPLTSRDDVPPELVALLGACLEKDPARRPAGAREVGEALATIQVQLGRTQTRLVVNPPTASHRTVSEPITHDVDLRDSRPGQDQGAGLSEATTQPTPGPTLPDPADQAAPTHLREATPPDPQTRLREQAPPQPAPDDPGDPREPRDPDDPPHTRVREHRDAPLRTTAHPTTAHPATAHPTTGAAADPDADPFDRATVVRPRPVPDPPPDDVAPPTSARPRWVVPVAVGAGAVLAAAAGLIVLGSLVGDPDTPAPTPTISAPPLPTGLTLTELPDGSVQLGWDDPSKGTTSYVVAVSSGGRNLPSVVAQANGVTVGGLTRGKPYCFVVKIPTGLGKPPLSGPFRCINGDSLVVSTATAT